MKIFSSTKTTKGFMISSFLLNALTNEVLITSGVFLFNHKIRLINPQISKMKVQKLNSGYGRDCHTPSTISIM